MHLPPKPSLPTHTKSYPLYSFQNLNSQGRHSPSIPNQVRCTCHLWLQTSAAAIDCLLFHFSLLWPNAVSLKTFWFDWFPIKIFNKDSLKGEILMDTWGLPIFFTSDNFSSCVWLALQEWQQHRRLVCAVHTGLNRLLENCINGSWTKVVRKLLDQFPVKMWAIGSMFVHIDTNWKDKNVKINQRESLINLMGITTRLIVIVDVRVSALPVQTTFEPFPWLFSVEMWLVLNRVSGGGVGTDDWTTRGFFFS